MTTSKVRDRHVYSAARVCVAIAASGLVVTSMLGCGTARTDSGMTAAAPAATPMVGTEPTRPVPAEVPGLTPNGWMPGSVGASVTSPIVVRRGEVQWGPAPPNLPAGATMAVLEGDPGAPGKLFTIRLRMPDGYRIAPHWHFSDEHVTVISGELAAGMGDAFDPSRMSSAPAGGFAVLPARHHHYAMMRGQTEIQIHSVGPWKLIYVNPADDPSRQTGR
jgi:hypothetical protein